MTAFSFCFRSTLLLARGLHDQMYGNLAAMQPGVFDTPLIISPQIRRNALRRRRLVLALPIVVALAVAAAIAWQFRSRPVAFHTAPVERRTITRQIEITGYLDVTRRVEVPSPLQGRLTEVLVQLGDSVTEGQPLATLDDRAVAISGSSARASLAAASSRVDQAEVKLKAASDLRERAERLNVRQLSSDAELEAARARESEARAALATARAERSMARAALRSAKLSESLSTIQTPMSGVVLAAPETTGMAVGPESGPLFVIGSDIDTLRIKAEVAESEVGALAVGQAAQFSVPAQAQRSFPARVERVGIDANRSSVAVRYPVELRADNPERLLLPGMTATVTIAVARSEGALATRDAALRFRPEGAADAPARSRVFRVTSHGLEEVPVRAGLSDGAFTEIRPLTPGALGVGDALAIGVVDPRAAQQEPAAGPGIHFGNR